MNKKSVLKVLLLLISGLFGLGQLQKIILTSSIQIFFHEIFMLIVICLTASNTISWSRIAKHKSIVKYPVLFSLYTLIITLLQFIWIPSSQIFLGLAYWLRLMLYEFFILAIFVLIQKGIVKKSEIRLLIINSTVFIAIFGLFQFFFYPDLRILRFSGWDDHYLRLASTLLDPSFSGIVMFLGFVTALKEYFISKSKQYVLYIFLLALAILLTYSRATYLAVFIWGSLLAWHTPTIRKKFLALLIFGCVAVLLLPRPASEGARLERLTSIQARIMNVTQTLQSFKAQEWIFGTGWYIAQSNRTINNTITTISHSSSPDNSFLHILQSTGAVGFTIFILWLKSIWKSLTQNGKALLVAVCVASIFSQILFYPFVMILLAYSLIDAQKAI